MKTVIAGAVAALGLLAVSPVMAQGVYVGPNGVGVDTGIRPYGYHRDYDRDSYRRHRDRDRDGYYEGRSSSRDRYDDRD